MSLRSLFRRQKFESLGEGTVVSADGRFVSAERIAIGDYCYVGRQAYWNGLGGIIVGDGSIIGPRSLIWTANHDFHDPDMMPYGPCVISKPVIVGRGCWIGADVRITPGVMIGDGVVVGLGAVVTKDVGFGEIVGGNPARSIGRRPDLEQVMGLIESENWYMKFKARKAQSFGKKGRARG